MQAASRSSSICQQQQARQHISSVVSRSPQFAHCEQTVWSTATPSATRVHQHLLLTAGEHKHAAGALHQPVFLAVAQPHRKSRRRVSHRADHPRHRLSGRAAPRGAAAVAGCCCSVCTALCRLASQELCISRSGWPEAVSFAAWRHWLSPKYPAALPCVAVKCDYPVSHCGMLRKTDFAHRQGVRALLVMVAGLCN